MPAQACGTSESLFKTHLSRKDFKKFIKIALPKINAEKMEDNLFRMYDTNMDGVISMEEFLIVYHIFSEGTPEENLTKEIRQQFSAVQSIFPVRRGER